MSPVNKDGSELATHSPRSPGSCPKGLILSPVPPDVRSGFLLSPYTWQPPRGQAPRPGRQDPKKSSLSEPTGAAQFRKLSKSQWLLPLGQVRGQGSGGTCETNKTSGGEGEVTGHKLVPDTYSSATHRPTPQPRSSLLPGTSAQAGAHESAGPPALPARTRPAPSAVPGQPSPHKPAPAPARDGGHQMKAARFVMRSAAPWSPRGRAFLALQPVSAVHEAAAGLRWEGEVGPGRSGELPQLFSPGIGRTQWLKTTGGLFLRNPGTSTPAHFVFLRSPCFLTVCACRSRPLAAPLMPAGGAHPSSLLS